MWYPLKRMPIRVINIIIVMKQEYKITFLKGILGVLMITSIL